jgi:hypothetical protein
MVKVVPKLATEALGGRGGTAPTHSTVVGQFESETISVLRILNHHHNPLKFRKHL